MAQAVKMNPEVKAEYDRITNLVGTTDPYKTEIALGIHDVLKAHFLIADHFLAAGSGLGGIGPRDLDLLHSALHRQHASFGPVAKWSSKFDIAATLFYGIIKNHAFFDANKRTAFLTLLYHLQRFKLAPTVTQLELEDFAVTVADNGLEKFNRFQEMREKSDDPEVKFISYYVKSHTRQIDKKYYTITYRRLRAILNRFGYDLANPNHNSIDVVRMEERRRIFGIVGPKEKVGVKVAQIGFPGWTSQVGQGAISTVRKSTNLTAEDGVDSSSFFHDEDPIDCLIAEYNEPLKRLADR